MSPYVRCIVAVCACCLLICSCAPKRSDLLLDTTVVSPATLIRMVEAGQQKLHSLVGGGSVTFESPGIAGSASFDLALKKPDSLLIRFEGPFGIDVGTLFLSRQKYVVYNSFENRVITGVPRMNALRSVIPFDLSYDEILNAFSGTFSIPQNTDAVHAYSIDDDRFLLSMTCGDHLCKYWIDPEYRYVTKYQVHDAQGRIILEALASSVTEQDSVSAPRRIRVKFPEEGRQISIYYSSLTLNAAHPSFDFSVPSNAKTIVR